MRNVILAGLAATAALFGCAPVQTGRTTLTSTDVPSPEPREAPRAEAAPPALDALPGELACRTTSIHEGTTELYLEWNGDAARGSLRTVAPSGNVTTERVRAERYKRMIVVDYPNAADLVTHAAVVGEDDGKKVMRVGGAENFRACDP